ncbi:MAG: flippase-like domain-containing protein, partial [Dehalococcoidia bacterium]
WIFLALASALPVALILGLLIMRFLKSRALRFVPGPLGQAYLRFHQGALGSFRNLPLIVLFGALGWLAEVARLFFVAEALGFSLSIPLIVFATLANAILTLLPLGGLGVAEFGVAELLTRSLTRSAAGSVVILDRAISYVSVIILGGIFFLVRNIVMKKRAGRGTVILD